MDLDTFQAYAAGYSDRLLDQQLLALQAGYWSAYYEGKHPKKLQDVSEALIREHSKKTSERATSSSKPEVDVESFLAREARFEAALNSR